MYAAMGDDPVNRVDPAGQCSFTLMAKIRWAYNPATKQYEPARVEDIWTEQNTPCHGEKQARALADAMGKMSGGGRRDGTKKKPHIPPIFIQCTGPARIIAGNSGLIGKVGAFGANMRVRDHSAAIIPRQFTGQVPVGPVMRYIGALASGRTSGGQTFSGFTDAIDHDDLAPRAELDQNIWMQRAPGRLIIEIVGGRSEDIAEVTLWLPVNEFGCPDNTREAGTFP